VRENIDFSKEICTFYQGVDQDKRPSMIAGNMNMVEDATRQAPNPHRQPQNSRQLEQTQRLK
jgi:hypothetical protein